MAASDGSSAPCSMALRTRDPVAAVAPDALSMEEETMCRSDRSQTPLRLRLAVALAAALLCSTALAAGRVLPFAGEQAQPSRDSGVLSDAIEEQFNSMDADGDTVLTLEEVPGDSLLYRDFARWDGNKDGVINVREFDRYVDQLAQL